ncbi:helix-turn-helix domain-containing protein [Bacillus sp. T33-2]|uniref:helix-turn-helix domain-containing protein n=1 Tax=Bacillus sp. T33-2 TaxID=2054168 RepID=UPI000C784A86|nr:helix-turn-helix transcriptional regulator [Bacillus sp. T33-2]PLR99622.1 hypothetical protein CVD19_00745 [Bacillus sp. T33-2]
MYSGMDLKVRRIMNDIEAQEVARYLGVSKTYISLMEKGKRRISQEMYERWAEFLGLNKEE